MAIFKFKNGQKEMVTSQTRVTQELGAMVVEPRHYVSALKRELSIMKDYRNKLRKMAKRAEKEKKRLERARKMRVAANLLETITQARQATKYNG